MFETNINLAIKIQQKKSYYSYVINSLQTQPLAVKMY